MVDRRAFLKEAGRTALGAGVAIIASSCDVAGTRGSEGIPANPFFSSDFSGSGRRWPDPWVNVRYGGHWELHNGEGAIRVDTPNRHALNRTTRAEYMGQPVVVKDKEVKDCEISVTLSIEGEAEAGLIARWCYDHAYALLVAGSEVLLVRYSTLDRRIMQRVTLLSGGPHRLTLSVVGDRVTGHAEGRGTTQKLSGVDPEPLQPGAVGVMVNPTSSEEGGEARFSSFAAFSTEQPASTTNRIAYRFTGGIVPHGDGFKARLTARTIYASPVGFEVAPDREFADPVVIEPSNPEGRWGSVHAWVDGLRAGDEYFWRPVYNDGDERVVGRAARFRTPARGRSVRFAFASCTSGRTVDFSSFARAASYDPAFYLHAGDWGYVNLQSLARSPDHWQHRWARLLRTSWVETLIERTPLMFWQDDHDYQADNGWAETVDPRSVWAFDEVHANPTDEYFDLRWGDLHVWCIDCRLFASDPSTPDDASKSRLGRKQKRWLKDGMRASDAPLRIVASPMPFRNKVSDDPGWHNVYTKEREELLSFFADLDATVVILSGDAHGHRLIHHFEYGELYEITASGTDWPAPTVGQGNHDPEHTIHDVEDKTGFALVELDPPGEGRMVTVRSISTLDGSRMFEKRLSLGAG